MRAWRLLLAAQDPTLGEELESATADAEHWLEENRHNGKAGDIKAKSRSLQTVLLRAQKAAESGKGGKGKTKTGKSKAKKTAN